MATKTIKWLAVLMCAVSMTPTIAVGQDRTRTRDRLSTRPELAPLLNIYTERQSRTRLGLYLDVDQSRRFDGDGALITRVMRDSPAEDAGLETGDVITVFEGQVLTIPLDDADRERDFDLDQSLPAQRLLVLAEDLEEGQTVEIRYLRDGASNTVSVEADEFEFPRVRTWGGRTGVWGVAPDVSVRPFPWGDYSVPEIEFGPEIVERLEGVQYRLRGLAEDLAIAEPAYAFNFGRTSAEGVEFIELNPELGEYFGSDSGVLVVEVDEESTLGLMAGDVVLAVGARDAESVRRVLRLIRSYDEDEPIRFRIIRMGSEMVAEGVLR